MGGAETGGATVSLECALCGDFIWVRGAVVFDKAICSPCAASIAAQQTEAKWADGFEEGYEAGFESRRIERIERDLEDARAKRRMKVPA